MYATQWWVLGKISRKVKYQQNKPVKHHTVNSIISSFFPKISRKLTKSTADKREITRSCISSMGALKESDVWQTSRFSSQIAFCLQVKKGEFNECDIRSLIRSCFRHPFTSCLLQFKNSHYTMFSIIRCSIFFKKIFL